jgi:hypothetical protein
MAWLCSERLGAVCGYVLLPRAPLRPQLAGCGLGCAEVGSTAADATALISAHA